MRSYIHGLLDSVQGTDLMLVLVVELEGEGDTRGVEDHVETAELLLHLIDGGLDLLLGSDLKWRCRLVIRSTA
jgi:hypothetical protein